MSNPIESVASKAMGAVKDVKATFKGLTGVFKHLMEEHGKVGALINRVKGSSDEKLRAELYPTIRRELLAHEKGEVEVVYPAISGFAETRGIVAQHSAEAQQLKAAIEVVDALSFSDAEWGPAFDSLAKLVASHVNEEESDFFPKAQEALGDEEAEALLPRFEAAKHN